MDLEATIDDRLGKRQMVDEKPGFIMNHGM